MKIGLDFPGESVLFEGVIIDQLAFDIRRNQVPKLAVQFKALKRTAVSAPALSGATILPVRRVHHVSSTINLDAGTMFLTEANLTFNQRKNLAQFNTSKQATKATMDGIIIGGQLVEYFGSAAKLPAAILGQSEHVFFLRLDDPAGTSRKLEFYLPRVIFSEALPDALTRGDLICRASMNGLSDLERDTPGPKIVLIA